MTLLQYLRNILGKQPVVVEPLLTDEERQELEEIIQELEKAGDIPPPPESGSIKSHP